MSEIPESGSSGSTADEQQVELAAAFREFEAQLWKHINGQDDDVDRRALAEFAAAELARIQQNVATEIEIVS